jgi:hypothetical protein
MKKSIKHIPLRYLPRRLSKKDAKLQKNMLTKSKKMYKHGKYYTRKTLKSFRSKKSSHILNAQKMYNVEKVGPTNELSKKTGCSKKALEKIVKKGQGAYFSSGSRPNQTSQSWGLARLASSVTGGKASVVDFDILKQGCNSKSKALKLAKKNYHKLRHTPKRKV